MKQTEIKPGPYKKGDKVMLDKEFNNGSEVEVVSCWKYFSTVQTETTLGKVKWDVMTCRLSDIPPKNEEHRCEDGHWPGTPFTP